MKFLGQKYISTAKNNILNENLACNQFQHEETLFCLFQETSI